MQCYKLILLLLLNFLLLSQRADSQSSDSALYKTGEISVFGFKVSTDNFFAPTKIRIITSKEINNKNGESLAEVLQTAGGVFIKSYGNTSALSTVSLNGLGSEHTLVLLNGFKINSTQNAQADLSLISKNNIERIEILNNGASSIYGSEAIGGVVNIITKTYLSKEPVIGMTVKYGSYDSRLFRMNFNKKISRFSLNLDYTNEKSKNNFSYYFNDGINKLLKERLNSGYSASDYLLNASYRTGKKSELNFYSDYKKSERNIPGQETGSAPSDANQKDDNFSSIISLRHGITGNLLLNTKINYQNNFSEYSNGAFAKSYYRNIYLSNSSQINYTGNNFELISGYDLSYSALKSNELEDNVKRIQYGLFLVSEFNVNRKIKLFPSARYDYISDIKKSVVSGKLGLNYRPARDINLNFKASSGNSFASPTFNELYWKNLGNKVLNPETAFNFDAGVIYGFKYFSANTIELTYTYINAKNKIVWTPNSYGNWTPQNLSNSESKVFSADIKVDRKFSRKFSSEIDFRYSYTSSKKTEPDYENDPTTGKQIFYIPKNLFKINLNLNYLNSGLNVFYVFTGKRFTDQENIGFLPANDLIEGNIYHKFIFNKVSAQIKLEANNILNTDYQIIAGYPMALRNFKVSVSLDY